MDYKYIEQLMERYWRCETSLEEEAILRAFFSQENVPSALLKFRPLFTGQERMKDEQKLGDDFDAKILSIIEESQTVTARTIPFWTRLAPLFKAAAVVAIIVTLVNAAEFSMKDEQPADEINYSSYQDTYQDPNAAYNQVADALELVSEGMIKAQPKDTAATGVQKP